MQAESYDVHKQFERGAVILSFDTEQIWGYLDLLSERQFQLRYPGALEAHTKLLESLVAADVSATWFLVGGMALNRCAGGRDSRMAGLPEEWKARIPGGVETARPLWYRRSFVDVLRKARPSQEIGLHGGLTHLIWTDPQASRQAVEWELVEGIKALEQASVHPLSFSFGREQEVHHELLPTQGIRSYRGRTVAPSFQRGRTLSGAMARLFDEWRCATPFIVWPQETLPGLWNIPSSLFLYPIRASRTKVVGLRTRLDRFRRGVAAAVKQHGIFHFCLHPENLTESPEGFSMFEEMLEHLDLSRKRGDIEVLTMSEVVARMERAREGESPAPAAGRTVSLLAGVRAGCLEAKCDPARR